MRKPITHLLWLGLFFCLNAYTAVLSAQCPVITNCPVGAATYCDTSINQLAFWNIPGYSWSPVQQDSNLHERPIDLSLKIWDTCGSVEVSYTLFLDLDQDNIHETAIRSSDFPPAGKVYAGNAYFPNYNGGDTAWFDRRIIPDSLKPRFDLEAVRVGDTTYARVCWTNPDTLEPFIAPWLPEGRHRVVWTVKSGSNTRACDTYFRVRDCAPPKIVPQANIVTDFNANGTAYLSIAQAIDTITDNVTTFDKLLYSMRIANTGPGFPTDSSGAPVHSLSFKCEDGDQHLIELWARDRVGNVSFTGASVMTRDTIGYCFYNSPQFCAAPFWAPNSNVAGVDFEMKWSSLSAQADSTSLPHGQFDCALLVTQPPASVFRVTARQDSTLLNGVSTLDMLLISKHILGIQPFDQPWKILAADVNGSKNISTLDIIEIRKAVLGINTKFPNQDSWRFFREDCILPANPFEGTCLDFWLLPTQPWGFYESEYKFLGYKVGDVNGNAVPGTAFSNLETEDRRPVILYAAYEDDALNLYVSGSEKMEGFQFELQDLSAFYTIEKVESPQIPAWSEEQYAWSGKGAAQGGLRVSCILPEGFEPDPAQPLLQLRLKSGQEHAAVMPALAAGMLQAEWYAEHGTVHPLHFAPELLRKADKNQVGLPQPNPAASESRIPLQLSNASEVVVQVFDLNGKLVYRTVQTLEAGRHWLRLPVSEFPASAAYWWQVQAGGVNGGGKLIR
jgi:hypothetical protein